MQKRNSTLLRSQALSSCLVKITFGKTMLLKHLILSIPLLTLASQVVLAQDNAAAAPASSPAAVTTLPDVAVSSIKNPLMVPYAKAYEHAKKIKDASDGMVDVMVRLVDKSKDYPDALRLNLSYDDEVINIPLDAMHGFVLVPDEKALASSAKYMVNRRSNDVGASMGFRPHFKTMPVTMREVTQMLAAAREARASIVPWYARVVSPTINSLTACSTKPSAQFFVRDTAGQDTALELKNEKDEFGRPAVCVYLYGIRDKYPDSSVLIAPEGTTFDYGGSLF